MSSTKLLAIVAILHGILISSCGNAQDARVTVYKAPFEIRHIEQVEVIVNEISSRWGLRTFKKDRKQMQELTQGQDAFFEALYLGDDPVIAITNVGVGTVLTLSVNDFGRMPAPQLNQLASDIVVALREQLNIELTEEPRQNSR